MRSRWGIAVVVTVFGLALASCASEADESAGTTAAPSTTTVPSPTTSTVPPATTTTVPPATITTVPPATTTTVPPTTTTTLPPFSDPIRIEGSGDDIVEVEVPFDEPAIVTFTHQGSANFAVWSHDSGGNNIDLLVNTIGAYSGTRPINFFAGEEVAFFEITANGPWTVVIEPLLNAPTVSLDGLAEGRGDAVIIDLAAASSAFPVSLTHSGQSNFAIWAYSASSSDLLVNTIGAYEGTVLADGGTSIYDITADGDWAIEIDR